MAVKLFPSFDHQQCIALTPFERFTPLIANGMEPMERVELQIGESLQWDQLLDEESSLELFPSEYSAPTRWQKSIIESMHTMSALNTATHLMFVTALCTCLVLQIAA